MNQLLKRDLLLSNTKILITNAKEHNWLSESLLKEIHQVKSSSVETACDHETCKAAVRAIFVQMAWTLYVGGRESG